MAGGGLLRHFAVVLMLCSWQRCASLKSLVETPVPYGGLRHLAAPKGYLAHTCPQGGITVDGLLQEPCWAAAAPTADFVDIVGDTGPVPWVKTAAKILWDDANLYIAAELQDPAVFAYEAVHDSIIFHDNDFEVFVDPDGDNWGYYELEVNARGQVWDLLLVRPYRNGGPPVMNWETIPPAVPTQATGPTGWRPARVAVHVVGSLNAAEGSTSWSVEMALPWSLLQQAANRQVPPAHGDKWRINFSRVHWNVTWSEQQQLYVKEPPDQPGYNFVWSPQWQVQMHQPETWGHLQFTTTPVLQAARAKSAEAVSPDPTWPARALLMDVYYAQTLCWQALKRFCASLAEAGAYVDLSDVDAQQVTIHTTPVSFTASAQVHLPGSSSEVQVMVDQLSRLVQTAVAADGSLPHFNPFEGSSAWGSATAPAAAVEAGTAGPAAQAGAAAADGRGPDGGAASNACLQQEV